VELYKKRDSRFYWYDFKWRGKRYRSSTKETNKKRAGKIAALRLSQAMGGIGPFTFWNTDEKHQPGRLLKRYVHRGNPISCRLTV